MARYCGNCGKQLEDGNKICPNCEFDNNKFINDNIQIEKKKDRTDNILVLMIVVISAAIIIAAVIFVMDHRDVDRTGYQYYSDLSITVTNTGDSELDFIVYVEYEEFWSLQGLSSGQSVSIEHRHYFYDGTIAILAVSIEYVGGVNEFDSQKTLYLVQHNNLYDIEFKIK